MNIFLYIGSGSDDNVVDDDFDDDNNDDDGTVWTVRYGMR